MKIFEPVLVTPPRPLPDPNDHTVFFKSLARRGLTLRTVPVGDDCKEHLHLSGPEEAMNEKTCAYIRDHKEDLRLILLGREVDEAWADEVLAPLEKSLKAEGPELRLAVSQLWWDALHNRLPVLAYTFPSGRRLPAGRAAKPGEPVTSITCLSWWVSEGMNLLLSAAAKAPLAVWDGGRDPTVTLFWDIADLASWWAAGRLSGAAVYGPGDCVPVVVDEESAGDFG